MGQNLIRRFKWLRKGKTAFCFLPILIFLAAMWFSPTLKSSQASTKEIQNKRKPIVLAPCKQSVKQTSYLEQNLFVNAAAPIPRPKARTTFQYGGACGSPEDIECTGTLCYHQCLGCPTGWTPTRTGNCCAKCCQGSNCGSETCCTST